jgi:hypothetical protein
MREGRSDNFKGGVRARSVCPLGVVVNTLYVTLQHLTICLLLPH